MIEFDPTHLGLESHYNTIQQEKIRRLILEDLKHSKYSNRNILKENNFHEESNLINEILIKPINKEIIEMAAKQLVNLKLYNSAMNWIKSKEREYKINGLTHTTDREITLNNFRLLNSVNVLRNQVGADIVSGIIDTDFTNFTACGLAFGHTSVLSNGPWTIGAGFSEYAYNITSYFCILYDFTFTHEFGHLLGTQHARDEPFTPVDVVTANGYPYAFGWRDGDFKSVMSTTQLTTSRRLNFSNPNVSVNGIPTGVNNSEHNQRVIDELTVFATNYRQRADLIFVGDFE